MDCAVLSQPYNHISFKRRKNTWYSVKDGNWTDPTMWQSNATKRWIYPGQNIPSPVFPQVGDDVYVNHSVTINVAGLVVNNAVISGSLIFGSTARTITVNGDIQAGGSVDMSSAAHNLILNGVNNYIINFTSGTTSTVTYARVGDQPIMDLTYRNLAAQNIGAKILPASVFSIVGTTTVTTGAVLTKADANQATFIGLLTVSSAGVDFSGNPIVEFRGGTTMTSPTFFNSGTNAWNFTTSTQTATLNSGTYQFTCPVNVVGAIALSEAGNGIMSLNQPINCTTAGGSLIGKGTIYFNSTSSLPSMTTGTFDRTTNANTVGYTMGASITLPYTTYSSLLVSNTGTKTALGNTTTLGNLSVSNINSAGGVFDAAAFDLTVNGTTSIAGQSGTSRSTLKKSGTGNIIFVGVLSLTSFGSVDFPGNPLVELRGGVSCNAGNASLVSSGTNLWKFTTNSQTFNYLIGVTFDCPILISGAITLTVTSPVTLNYPINGDNAASTLINKSTLSLNTSTIPMVTGVFSYNDFTTSTIAYIFNGDYTLPYTSYQGLAVSGTGTKSVSGNTTVSQNLLVGNGFYANLDLLTYNLSVNGTTTISGTGANVATLMKSGAGSVTFIGALSLSVAAALDFSLGNPSVELRGGITSNTTAAIPFSTGTGSWLFSTNNQSITVVSQIPFDAPVTISGAITLTSTAGSNAVVVFRGTLNGNNAASTFDNRATTQYQNTQRPMLTGILQTNAAANTFLYNKNGSQDVSAGIYRTMQIGGTATPNDKTLQGNITVVTAYSVTGNAALVLNGFTKS